jgi:hypothetical protein
MKGRSVGVDPDGVLANQVIGVLPRVAASYGVVLEYKDIVDWQLPIIGVESSSDIAKEIVGAPPFQATLIPYTLKANDPAGPIRRVGWTAQQQS